MVVAGVAAAALGALQRRLGHALADQQHVAQVDGEVPARVELPVPLDLDVLESLPQFGELVERLGDLVGLADDADQAVHRVLQVELQRVRILGRVAVRRPLERAQRPLGGGFHLLLGYRWAVGERAHVIGGTKPGAAAENQQVGQRVAAQPVGPVHATSALTRREQSRRGGPRGIGVDLDTAHHVVTGRPDFHRFLGDVHLGQLHELVIHRRQPALDLLGGQPRCDVEEHAAVRGVTAGLYLGVDGASHLVPR